MTLGGPFAFASACLRRRIVVDGEVHLARQRKDFLE
jgi:hypothetical protein